MPGYVHVTKSKILGGVPENAFCSVPLTNAIANANELRTGTGRRSTYTLEVNLVRLLQRNLDLRRHTVDELEKQSAVLVGPRDIRRLDLVRCTGNRCKSIKSVRA